MSSDPHVTATEAMITRQAEQLTAADLETQLLDLRDRYRTLVDAVRFGLQLWPHHPDCDPLSAEGCRCTHWAVGHLVDDAAGPPISDELRDLRRLAAWVQDARERGVLGQHSQVYDAIDAYRSSNAATLKREMLAVGERSAWL